MIVALLGGIKDGEILHKQPLVPMYIVPGMNKMFRLVRHVYIITGYTRTTVFAKYSHTEPEK